MTVPYCEPRDVYDLGLSAGSFVVRPRPLDPRAGDLLDFATGTFWLLGHGLAPDDLVWLALIASGGALPTGASPTTPYYPLPIDSRRFRLSTSQGGSPVTFADAGTSSANGASSWGILIDPERRLRACILAESADVDQCLTAHSTPIEVDPATGKHPVKLRDVVARGAARRAIAGMLFENSATKIPTERLDGTAKADAEQKDQWSRGQPLYPTPIDQTAQTADNAMRAQSGVFSWATNRYPVYWSRGTL